jgi:acyl dehydratase
MTELRRAVGLAAPAFRGVIERVKVIEYAQALQLHNPIHFDREAAVAAGFRDVVVPAGFINPFTLQPRAWKFDTFRIDEHRALAGEWSWEQHAIVCAGDELHGASVLVELGEKHGKRPMEVLVIETRYLNERDENVVTFRDVTLEFKEQA